MGIGNIKSIGDNPPRSPEKCTDQGVRDTFRDQKKWVQNCVDVKSGYLIADDTILDKPREPKIEEARKKRWVLFRNS